MANNNNTKNPVRKYAEVRKYDKEKSKWIFGLLKLGEAFAVFLFTFGIYGLGCLANNLVGTIIGRFFGFIKTTTIIGIWAQGLGFLFFGLVSILIICAMGWFIYELIKAWAEMGEKQGYHDARNEATVHFCQNIVKLAEKDNVHFPFI